MELGANKRLTHAEEQEEFGRKKGFSSGVQVHRVKSTREPRHLDIVLRTRRKNSPRRGIGAKNKRAVFGGTIYRLQGAATWRAKIRVYEVERVGEEEEICVTYVGECW